MSSILFGNGTDIVHWNPSSKTRGTFDILSTCIITMLLCVWTAVHLNISPPGSVWSSRLRKVGWLVLALLAPEMVAYTAWYQRRQALSIMRTVNNAFVLPDPPSWLETAARGLKDGITSLRRIFMSHEPELVRQPTLEAQRTPLPQDRHPWTVVHGFYAEMGGIAFEIPENLPESRKFLPSHSEEAWFIGHKGVQLLSGHAEIRDILPNLSTQEIESKSKANGLAKTLVCIQALWFIAQCITRLTESIPISLLELNTFGHAVCMLLIYFLWWEKPFEVDLPTKIEGQILWDIRAFHFMTISQSTVVESFHQEKNAYIEGSPWYQTLSMEEKRHFSILAEIEREMQLIVIPDDIIDNGNQDAASDQRSGRARDHKVNSVLLAPGEYLDGTSLRSRSLQDIFGPTERYQDYDGSHPPKIRLSSHDITRWRMAWRAIQAFGTSTVVDIRFHIIDVIKSRCESWPELDYLSEDFSVALGFSVAPFLYGGLHALAWFAHFDSSTEQLLWRISACIVMGGVPVLCGLGAALDGLLDHFRFNIVHRELTRIVMWSYRILLTAYILARAYLVVECFINLSHLPAGVYDVPSWAAYFPHIS